LDLNEGSSVTGETLVSISMPSGDPFMEDGAPALQNIQISGLTDSIPMDAMPVEGAVLFTISTQIDGVDVSLASEESICYECGAAQAYFATPNAWLEYGFQVHAYADDSAHTENNNLARYMHTGLHDMYGDDYDSSFVNDEVGTCLIIQESNDLTPISNSGGGNITFYMTEADSFFELQLFNVQQGGTVVVFASDGSVSSIPVEASDGIQNIVVKEEGTERVTVQFDGPGAICGIKSCITGTRPPSPGNNNPPVHTPYPVTPSPTISVAPSSSPSDAPSPSPSSEPSSSPTDCYDKYGITEEDIINQAGTEGPIPEDAVMKINGEHSSVTIELFQLWSNDTNISFFIQYHSDTHDTVCEGIPDFSYEDSITIDSECYDGWTDFGIFGYTGEEYTIDECEECKPPDQGDEGIFAYYFELSCEPICDDFEPTAAPDLSPPTDCLEEYGITEDELIKQIGAEEPVPEDAMKIIEGEETNVIIEITQLWSNDTNATFYIQHHSDTHETVCEGIPDFAYEDTIVKNLECYNGWTDMAFFVYFDGSISLDECEECKAPDEDDESVVAYYFEIPCTPICEEEPTAAPKGSPPEPDTPEPTMAPTDCYDRITADLLIDSFGPSPEEPLPEDAIKIITGDDVTVTLEISQLWSQDVNVSTFVQYHEIGHGSVCEAIPDFSYEDSIVKEMECYDGWTDFGFFMYLDEEMVFDECEECKPPDSEDENVIAYYFEIPCKPVCVTSSPSSAPSLLAESATEETMELSDLRPIHNPGTEVPGSEEASTDCYDGISVTKDTGEEAMCEFSAMPFEIEELDESGTNEVRFSFTNSWDTALTVELFYDRGNGEKECQSLNSLDSGTMHPTSLSAACNEQTKLAEIEVLISSDLFSHSSSSFSGECGASGDNSCSFIYQIPCVADVSACGDISPNRKLDDSVVANEEMDGYEDTPYCSHKDYPCNGDEENMVYVCHYSSRAGYQTFCMPEMDSDVIRYNENHHCGPCDGWNGIDQAK